MTLVEWLTVVACGMATACVFVATVIELKSRHRNGTDVNRLTLVHRMIQATALRCGEQEAHAVIRACSFPSVLSDEVARLEYGDASELTEAQLHRLFMLCVHRTLTRVGGRAYRSESNVLN